MIKIKIENDSLSAALETVQKTAPPASGVITVEVRGGKMAISSLADLSRCRIVVPCEIVGDTEGEFAVTLQSIKDATKNRNNLVLSYDQSMLRISASPSYKADLATVDVIPIDKEPESETTEWKVSQELAEWLRSSLREVALKPTSLLSSWMPVGVKVTSKSAFVSCYDTQHISWKSSKEVTGDFECVLPVDVLQTLIEVFHKTPFKMVGRKNSVTFVNKLVRVVLALPSTEDIPPLEQVQERIKSAVALEGKSWSVPKQELNNLLDNSRSVIGKERAEIEFQRANSEVTIQVKTSQGQVKNRFKSKGEDGEFRVDYELLRELVAKVKGEDLNLLVVDSSFLRVKLDGSNAILALNQ